jgi:hypothetical protein
MWQKLMAPSTGMMARLLAGAAMTWLMKRRLDVCFVLSRLGWGVAPPILSNRVSKSGKRRKRFFFEKKKQKTLGLSQI